ncbi:MAG: hypothetical protein ABL995_04040 [Bryobacteraceae bacterium]
MRILFAPEAAEAFHQLPESAKRKAAISIDLLLRHPSLYPIRRRGIMRGYRYFVADRFLIYYKVSSAEIRVSSILPGMMQKA